MSQFVKFARALAKDEAGVVTMEWAVAASILAVAGIGAFIAIGTEVGEVLTAVNTAIANLGPE